MKEELRKDLTRRLNELRCDGTFEIDSESPYNIVFINTGVLWNCDIDAIMKLVKEYDAMIYITENRINIHKEIDIHD